MKPIKAILSGATFSVLAALLFAAVNAQAAQPNIILVMPDDVGYGDYACLGNPIMRTRSVDSYHLSSCSRQKYGP